jgi:hypothetical protein
MAKIRAEKDELLKTVAEWDKAGAAPAESKQ